MTSWLAILADCAKVGIACAGLAYAWTRARDPNAGGAADARGCMTTAGYVWCEAARACVRPWELVGCVVDAQ